MDLWRPVPGQGLARDRVQLDPGCALVTSLVPLTLIFTAGALTGAQCGS